ncbi:MAG: ankyrin repeat domain-containing protein [Deltaproteobacteria bacterium]|nr:ankyrin repeat domain-containing protein [Deltaproteobacteria bacterium]
MREKRCLQDVLDVYADRRIFNDPAITVHSRDCLGDTLLHAACESDDLESVRILVNAGADVNALGEWELTPLIVAVRYGSSSELVEYLIEEGASIEVRDFDDDTPLHIAARRGVEHVRLILDAGADVNSRGDMGMTALHAAVDYTNDSMVALLVSRGAVLLEDEFGRTPLSEADERCDVYERICDELEQCARQSSSIANWSKSRSEPSSVEQAVEGIKSFKDVSAKFRAFGQFGKEGITVHSRDNSGFTLLHHACGVGDFEAARTLLGEGADVNAKNNRGTTALHMAAEKGYDRIVKLLLENGAVVQENEAGESPLDLATKNRDIYRRILEELRKVATPSV